MKKQDLAGLTEGPSGTVGLKGHPEPGLHEKVWSKDTGSYGDWNGPAGNEKVTSKIGGTTPAAFTRPGGVTEI